MQGQTGGTEKAGISEPDWCFMADFARAANMRNPRLLTSVSQSHRNTPASVYILPLYASIVLRKALRDRYGTREYILENVERIATRLFRAWYKMTHRYRSVLIHAIRYAFAEYDENPLDLDPSAALRYELVLIGLVLTSFDEQIWALRSHLEEMIENNSESFLRLGALPDPWAKP